MQTLPTQYKQNTKIIIYCPPHLQILKYFSQSVDVDGLNLLAYSAFELFDCAGCIFVHFAIR